MSPTTIEADTVVSMHYTLRGDDQAILDSSTGSEPLLFLHGHGQIIPGLENALTGKKVGDTFKVSIPAEDGYGAYDEALTMQVTRAQFPEGAELEVGSVFELVGDNQEAIPARITALEGDTVKLDANHPLAGQALHFEIEVVSVRPATEEELEHGHAHGGDGHHHH
jgi:FKBP-type peptidyl-prolyl cis-trans isomerase SlyD